MDRCNKNIYKNKMIDLNQVHLKVRHCRHREDIAGTQWGPRTNPDYEILLVETGLYTYSDADGELRLEAGDLLLIEPSVEHTFRKETPDNGSHFSAHFDLMDANGALCLLEQLKSVEHRKTMVAPPYISEVFQLASEQFESRGRFSQEIVNSSIRSIWLVFSSSWYGVADAAFSDRMQKMMQYLRDHLDQPVTRLDLAREFHCSPEHVNFLFKKELNETPCNFLNRERVFKAFTLMKDEGLNVQEAAQRTGFSNQYYFSRVFKQFFECPPSHIKMYRTGEIDRIFSKHIPT